VEIEAVLADPDSLGIYGKLSDRFGENGLISVVLGHRKEDMLDIDLWLMSCRVLKRDMEIAMLDVLIEHARAMGITTLRGYYLPTKKNGLVRDHFKKLGFAKVTESADGSAIYLLEITGYTPRNSHIKVMELVHEQ
jgi:FkbH-like protein